MSHPSPVSINASAGFGEVLNYLNIVTGNWISNLLLMAIYFIVLIGFYKAQGDFKGALAVSGYGTFVVGLFFWIGGFVSGITFGMTIGVALIGTLVLLLDHN